MSWDPEVKRQEAIEIACYNAIRAMCDEPDPRLALAAALEAIERERTARRPGLSLPFNTQDCIAHLRASAALPRKG